MHKALSVLTCALALADASQKFPQLKHVRRDGSSSNNATSNSALNSTSSTVTTSTLILSTGPAISSSFTSPPADPASPAPIYPANNTSYQNISASTTTSQASCLGSVTYYDSVPPTVYATITESFLVTVSASNASLPPPQLSTPPVACTATVIPSALTSNAPLLSLGSSGTDTSPITAAASSSINSACPYGVCFPGSASEASTVLSFQPALTVITLSFAPAATPAASLASNSNEVPQVATTNAPASPVPSSGSAFTSTVFVTEKTPVPVVVPPTSAPPVFQIPSTTKNPTTTKKSNVAGSSAEAAPESSSPNVGTSKAPPVASQSPTTTQIGNIIASIINQPFTPVSSGTSKIPAQSPVTTTIDNVPVQILPSSVVIGGQVLSIPGTSSKTTLEVNGQTFTVQNSQIIAPGTTYAITPDRNQEGSATAAPSPVTAGGLTFSVGASQAVISGSTYAIGIGAGSSTTVLIGSKTVIIGSGGVVLPSTTVAPVKVTIAPIAPEVVTAAGLTFTVGPSFAVISGSTYTIGPGAKPTSLVVGGKTISIGSNGIGLASTTIAPEPNFSVITVGGLTFSVDSSEAILKGTTYKIGKGAPTETTVVSGKTLSLGPGGVGLPSTTIPPETGAAPSSTGVLQGGATLFSISSLSVLSALLAGLGAVFL